MISISETNGGISTQPRKKWKPAENHRTQTYLDLPEPEDPSEEPAPAGTRQRSKLQYFPIPRGKIVFSPFQKPSAATALLFLPLYSPWHRFHNSKIHRWKLIQWLREEMGFVPRQERKRTKDNGHEDWKAALTQFRIWHEHETNNYRSTWKTRSSRAEMPVLFFRDVSSGIFPVWHVFRFPLSATGAKSMGTGKMRRESRSSFVSSTCGL